VKALAVAREEATPSGLVGRVACHDVRDGAGRLLVRKGQALDGPAVEALLAAPWQEVHVLELEPGDLHEEPAGARLSQAAAGPGVEVKGYQGGQWTLAAGHRGLLRIRQETLARVNHLPGMSVFTLYDLTPVEAGETVARAKVTPLALPEALVREAEVLARAAGGLLTVRPFTPARVGAVARESLEPGQRERFEASLREKLRWFGAALLPVRYSGADAGAVAADLVALVAEGAQVLVVAGASALDPLDPVFLGIERAGGRMERHGVPAHPGSLFFLAWLGERPVLGMPTCGMFSQATTFDLVLPRVLAGERVGAAELAALGHGGLLSRDSAWRFPPYRQSAARGEVPE
jgi:molybdopterin biosynthesis enzyme